MSSDKISVISIQEIDCEEEEEGKEGKNESKWMSNAIVKSLGFLLFGIIGLGLLFAIPWTTIPRTNSIIYQSYWMEALLPAASTLVVYAVAVCNDLATWTNEKELMSIVNILKLYSISLLPYMLLYISCYAIWSVYFQFNHPMPFLGLMVVPMIMIFSIGLWFTMPSYLLAKKHFRRSLQIYMFFSVWVQAVNIQKEILSYLFANAPFGFQFLVPFLVAGCRELDKHVKSKLMNKMNGSQDESAKVLVAVQVSCQFSFFIAIRLVDASLLTICSTVAIDSVLHLKMTYEIIKELRKVYIDGRENETTEVKTKMTKLIIAELIERLTPIIWNM